MFKIIILFIKIKIFLSPPAQIFTCGSNLVYGQTHYTSLDHFTNLAKVDEINPLAAITALLNGTIADARKIKRHHILSCLWAINRIELPLNKKLIIWDVIKNNNPVNNLKRIDLEATGKLLLSIPETDLYNLNYSDWDTINYLGTLPGFTRRQVGVIGYAIKNKWGSDIIKKVHFLNKIKGLICAFPPQELDEITPTDFLKLKKDVFENIRPCTERQKKVLLYKAKLSNTYGPPQAWTMHEINKLALLLTAMKPKELYEIRPEATEGIEHQTIKAMSIKQLQHFTPQQLQHFSDLALAAYRQKIGIKSNTCISALNSYTVIVQIGIHVITIQFSAALSYY